MNAVFTYTNPDAAFWASYSRLWQNSQGRSPFQSPHILEYFAGRAPGELAIVQGHSAGELRAVAILRKQNGVYSFLSDMKTDANFFILHRACTPDDIQSFFQQFLHIVKTEKWALMLNNQPAWASYMEQFEAAGKASGLYWQHIRYSVCPIVEEATPEALFQRINGSRELRYRVNKLKNQENAEFEVFTDDTDLDHWVDEFCQAHVLRWADTPTPSSYRDPARCAFLKGCLRAWSADGILRRFSVKVARGRVGFVVGLLEENSLIHHSTTFHPDYWKHSPGKALIHFMASWMQEQQMRVLDFGDGDEPYKYTVANTEHQLDRIFISNPLNLGFILKTKAIQVVRDNPKMYDFYRDKIKRLTQRAKA
ncbi:MAG: GNAT family N-acetyltransferase [Saprospiraceae bacterium]|nr:GNAT family N-acetyltransferase [Saprospiraceae bacterium]